MVKITMEVAHCNKCAFSESTSRQVGLSTNDDYMLEWCCKKQDKKIGLYNFGENVEIPDFCPFQNL